ncbi:hypothetical protein [Rhizobium sp. CCGE 510]|uniref:hypothetical protein n=1 Tax=Rhizobium sp. CCGE 510 TaxID=1132836 RepID=UPI0009D97E75|nr:hypothetical protein [Rhizobium sp. CCGE 510]
MRRNRLVDDTVPKLRDHRAPMVELTCRSCDRHCSHERKLLVRTFGAGASLAEIRRRMAMGCERMLTPEGDRCGAHFPSLADEDRDGT